MFSQDAADQQFLDEVARRYPNSTARGKLEEANKKYPKMYKNIIARAKAAPDESWKEYAKSQYGWIVDLYDAVPDLKKIVDEAVRDPALLRLENRRLEIGRPPHRLAPVGLCVAVLGNLVKLGHDVRSNSIA